MNESAGFDQPGTSGSSAARPPPQIPAVALRRRENCSMLMVTGQIDAVELISVPNVYCKYSFVYGLDWKQVAGSEEGISATGYKPSSGYKIVLNTPIEATFSFTNPFKWPQIVLSFYGQDALGNDVVRGYSATHLPTVPGRTKRRCPIFLPQASTAIQRLMGFFTGRRAEFIDPRIMAMAESRDVIRVSTQGFVELSLTAVLRDTKKFGYDLSPQTMMKFSEFPLNWPPKNEEIGGGPSTDPSSSIREPIAPMRRQRWDGGRAIETIHEGEEELHQQQQLPQSYGHQEIVHVETMVEESADRNDKNT